MKRHKVFTAVMVAVLLALSLAAEGLAQKEKEKESSKKGAFYYRLDRRRYNSKFHAFLNFIPNPDNLK